MITGPVVEVMGEETHVWAMLCAGCHQTLHNASIDLQKQKLLIHYPKQNSPEACQEEQYASLH